MKIYISGKITDNPNARNEFEKQEAVLIMDGHFPVNPFNLNHDHDMTWESFMREDIKALLDCEAIYMLKNWKKSKGAKIEKELAEMLGMRVIYETNPDFNSVNQ